MNAHLPSTLPDLDRIEDGFKESMRLFEEAFAKIAEADAAITNALAAVANVTPGAKFHDQSDANELKAFYKAVRLPDRTRYLHTARKIMNVRCWHYTVDRCGLQQLMDHQAKKDLDAQLRYVPDRTNRDGELITEDEASKGPPPFTAENARATLARFAAESNTIWRRGIANVFSSLDRRFRSHDGFKVGSRIILTYFVSDSGLVLDYGNASERFRDIERTFQILDGRDPRHARSDFLFQVKEERSAMGLGWKAGQSEHENAYFKVRIFKNGNAHLWFTRKDLVELVNKELAAYYGEVIGDGQTKEEDPFENRAVTPARLFGFYPTPPRIAEAIMRQVPCDKPLRILEPSAGTGNFAYRLAQPVTQHGKTVRHTVDAIEIQPDLAASLRDSGHLNRVITADFLQVPADAIYDGIVMNPPFDRERDIDHVAHAIKFLKADGWLLAIMSAGVEFRETKKAAAFRKLLDKRNGWMIDLPAGSFAEVGTHVNTVLVGIGMRKPYGIF